MKAMKKTIYILICSVAFLSFGLSSYAQEDPVATIELNFNIALGAFSERYCCTNYCSESEMPDPCGVLTPLDGAVCGECYNSNQEIGVYTQDLNTPSNDTTFDSQTGPGKTIHEIDTMIRINTRCMKLISAKTDSLETLESEIQSELISILNGAGSTTDLSVKFENKKRIAGELKRLNFIQNKISTLFINSYMKKLSKRKAENNSPGIPQLKTKKKPKK